MNKLNVFIGLSFSEIFTKFALFFLKNHFFCWNINQWERWFFCLELEDVIEEYLYHCLAKGFTPKTMKNKRQEMKQLKRFLMDEKGISELEAINTLHLKQYVRTKYKEGLQPQSIVSMFKLVRAFL